MSILALFASSFGFTSGAVVSLLPPTVSQILPANKVGARMGAFYSIISIATLTGAPVGGAILNTAPEKSDDYHWLIVYSVSFFFFTSEKSILNSVGFSYADRIACAGCSKTCPRP